MDRASSRFLDINQVIIYNFLIIFHEIPTNWKGTIFEAHIGNLRYSKHLHLATVVRALLYLINLKHCWYYFKNELSYLIVFEYCHVRF